MEVYELPDFLVYGLLGGNATNVEISHPCNILHHIEYPSDFTRVSAGYLTFFYSLLDTSYTPHHKTLR